MGYHCIERKVEQALKLWLATIGNNDLDAAQKLTRFDVSSETFPCIKITCARVEPTEQNAAYQTGNYDCDVTIELRSHYADTSNEQHDKIMSDIVDELFGSGFVDDLNTVSGEMDFKSIMSTVGTRTNEVDGHAFVTKQEIRIKAAPSRL